MDIKICQLDEDTYISVDGIELKNVSDYKLSTSADGFTEVDIKLRFKNHIKLLEMSTNSK